MEKQIFGTQGLSRRSLLGGALVAGLGLATLPQLAFAAETSSTADAKQDSTKASSAAADSAAADSAELDPNATRTVYVPAEWVQEVIDGKVDASKNYVILEVSWGELSADSAYNKGHIPGAVHMNTDSVEEEENWNYRSAEVLTELALSYGITKDTTVICYADKVTNSADDRVAVALLYLGVESVKCLDGGYEAWQKFGGTEETTLNEPKATTEEFGVETPAHPEYILSIDEVQEKLANDPDFKLVSIRSYEEYIGETSGYSYITRAGEPLGAIWGHDTDDGSYATDEGTTVSLDVLEGYLEDYGVTLDSDTAFYCGTGWRASIPFLIAYQNGIDVQLYDSGWFVWQKDGDNDVQLGDPVKGSCEITKVSELSTDKAKVAS